MTTRNAEQRRTHAIQRLESDSNVWIATASSGGSPHLVPLSLAWDGAHVILATPTNSPTARNVNASGKARLALDSTQDVVIIDTTGEAVPLGSAPPDPIGVFAGRTGWDPREESGEWSLLILQPHTVRAWNSVQEIDGRTIMKNGSWV